MLLDNMMLSADNLLSSTGNIMLSAENLLPLYTFGLISMEKRYKTRNHICRILVIAGQDLYVLFFVIYKRSLFLHLLLSQLSSTYTFFTFSKLVKLSAKITDDIPATGEQLGKKAIRKIRTSYQTLD
jgi:hypothetical protein